MNFWHVFRKLKKENEQINKKQVPYLCRYIDSVGRNEIIKALYKIDAEVRPREKAFLTVELLQEIHSHYAKQYQILAVMYEQLLNLSDVTEELRKLREDLKK